jgi:hypothetical protein
MLKCNTSRRRCSSTKNTNSTFMVTVGTGRVEERRGARPTGSRRFRSPLIKPDVQISRIRLSDWISPPGSRTRLHPDSTQLNNAQPAVDRTPREAGISATRPHLMTPPEVMPYAFVDIIIDRPICLRRRAVGEICAPTSQNLIQSISHLRPRLNVIRYQKVSHFQLDTRHALLGRTRSQIPTAIRLEAMWANV